MTPSAGESPTFLTLTWSLKATPFQSASDFAPGSHAMGSSQRIDGK